MTAATRRRARRYERRKSSCQGAGAARRRANAESSSVDIRAIFVVQALVRATSIRRSVSAASVFATAWLMASANVCASDATSTMSPCSALNRLISVRSVATTGLPMARYSLSFVG